MTIFEHAGICILVNCAGCSDLQNSVLLFDTGERVKDQSEGGGCILMAKDLHK